MIIRKLPQYDIGRVAFTEGSAIRIGHIECKKPTPATALGADQYGTPTLGSVSASKEGITDC